MNNDKCILLYALSLLQLDMSIMQLGYRGQKRKSILSYS